LGFFEIRRRSKARLFCYLFWKLLLANLIFFAIDDTFFDFAKDVSSVSCLGPALPPDLSCGTDAAPEAPDRPSQGPSFLLTPSSARYSEHHMLKGGARKARGWDGGGRRRTPTHVPLSMALSQVSLPPDWKILLYVNILK